MFNGIPFAASGTHIWINFSSGKHLCVNVTSGTNFCVNVTSGTNLCDNVINSDLFVLMFLMIIYLCVNVIYTLMYLL